MRLACRGPPCVPFLLTTRPPFAPHSDFSRGRTRDEIKFWTSLHAALTRIKQTQDTSIEIGELLVKDA